MGNPGTILAHEFFARMTLQTEGHSASVKNVSSSAIFEGHYGDSFNSVRIGSSLFQDLTPEGGKSLGHMHAHAQVRTVCPSTANTHGPDGHDPTASGDAISQRRHNVLMATERNVALLHGN